MKPECNFTFTEFKDNPVWKDYKPPVTNSSEEFKKLYYGCWDCPQPLYYQTEMMDIVADSLRACGYKVKYTGECSFEVGGQLFVFTDEVFKEVSHD